MSDLKRIVRDELEAVIQKGIDNQVIRAAAILKSGAKRHRARYFGSSNKCARTQHEECKGFAHRGHGLKIACTCECHKGLGPGDEKQSTEILG